jgi:DNA-binding MarR family transcriptional regulator
MGDLGAAEQVSGPTITRVANALVEAGLVAREPDPKDGRVTWVRVTRVGAKLLERSRRRKEAYLVKAFRGLDPTEIETLEDATAILERLTGGNAS